MNRRIGILLLVLVQFGCSSPIIAKRSDESQAVQQINALRAKVSEAYQVANMHEMVSAVTVFSQFQIWHFSELGF